MGHGIAADYSLSPGVWCLFHIHVLLIKTQLCFLVDLFLN